MAWSGTGHADGHGRNRHHLGDAGAGGGGQEEQDRVAVEDVLFSGLLVSRDDDENMTAAAAQGGEGVRIGGDGGKESDRSSLQAHALPVSRANGGPPSPSTPSSWLLGPVADRRDAGATVDAAPHAQHEQQAEQPNWLRLLNVRRALMLFGSRGAGGWRARAEDGWEREDGQARRAPAQEGQQEQDDAFTAACQEAREDGKLTREGGGGDAAGEEQVEEERQCRICFGGEFDNDSRRDRGEEEDDGEEEEEEDLGRLISPCLCSGSMRVSFCPAEPFAMGGLCRRKGGGGEGDGCNALLGRSPSSQILLSGLLVMLFPGVTSGTEHSQRNGWLTRDSPLLLSLLSDLARLVYRSLN